MKPPIKTFGKESSRSQLKEGNAVFFILYLICLYQADVIVLTQRRISEFIGWNRRDWKTAMSNLASNWTRLARNGTNLGFKISFLFPLACEWKLIFSNSDQFETKSAIPSEKTLRPLSSCVTLTSTQQVSQIWNKKWARFAPYATNLKLFKGEPKCTENDLKSPIFVLLGANLAHFRPRAGLLPKQ